MTNPIQEVHRLGQSVWYDNIRRGLLTSGELLRLIELGITGLTSNPTIFEKAIAGSTDYDETLTALARVGKSVKETYETLVVEDIRAAADLLRPRAAAQRGTLVHAWLEDLEWIEDFELDAERLLAAGAACEPDLDRRPAAPGAPAPAPHRALEKTVLG